MLTAKAAAAALSVSGFLVENMLTTSHGRTHLDRENFLIKNHRSTILLQCFNNCFAKNGMTAGPLCRRGEETESGCCRWSKRAAVPAQAGKGKGMGRDGPEREGGRDRRAFIFRKSFSFFPEL